MLSVKLRLGTMLSRESKATSEGELTRVGTSGVLKFGGPEVRATLESFGKTRYISATTSPIVGAAPVVDTNNPVKVAELMNVVLLSTKSSAVSISILPPNPGRVARAILPSTFPVLKKNGPAFSVATPMVD